MTDSPRCRGDRGQVGGIEALPFGVLVFVIGGLIVANAWAVIDAKMAVVAAARETARTYVEGDGPAGWDDAMAAGKEAIGGHGRNPDLVELTVTPAGEFERCLRVVVEAAYPVKRLTLPWIGGLGGDFEVHASHSEIIDPFRDGIEGAADCG
jgi:hypothetical protein